MQDYYMSDGDASVKKFSTPNAGYLAVLSKAVMSYKTGNRTQKVTKQPYRQEISKTQAYNRY